MIRPPALAASLLRLVLASALLFQTMLGGALMLGMELAGAAIATGSLAVICTPDGAKTLAVPGEDDRQTAPDMGCLCACAAFCNACSSPAPAMAEATVIYAASVARHPGGNVHGLSAVPRPHGYDAPRAPPGTSI